MDVHAQSMIDLVSRTSRVASIDETGVLITLQELEAAASDDPEYEQLVQAVTRGFPEARHLICAPTGALGIDYPSPTASS